MSQSIFKKDYDTLTKFDKVYFSTYTKPFSTKCALRCYHVYIVKINQTLLKHNFPSKKHRRTKTPNPRTMYASV